MRKLEVMGAFLAVSVLTGCGSEAGPGSEQAEAATHASYEGNPAVYLPTWLEEGQYDPIAGLTLKQSGVEIILAFAVPTKDGHVEPLNISPGVKKVVNSLGPDGKVILGVGGYGGTEKAHNDILDGWAAADKNSDAFAADVKKVVEAASNDLGHSVTGIDFDREYPKVEEAKGLSDTVAAVDAALPPDTEISIAVPNGHDDEGIKAAMPAMAPHVDIIRDMTYDEHTPYDGEGAVAGPITSLQWAASGLRAWRQTIIAAGSRAKLEVGTAAYCYGFKGAQKAGDTFNGGSNTPYSQIDKSKLTIQPDGTEAGKIGDEWTTCIGPTAVNGLLQIAGENGVTKAFTWEAQGLNPEYLAAISRS